MKKLLLTWGLLVLMLGILGACGSEAPDDYPAPTPYDYYEDYHNDYYPDPAPTPEYVPGFDHYDVSITIDPGTRTVSGISRTTFSNRTGEPLGTIVIRVFFNAFNEGNAHYFSEFERSIFRHGHSYGYMDIQHVSMNNEDVEYNLESTVLTLYPDEPLSPGETVQLVLQYNAYVPSIAHRTGANQQAMWFGMFLPVVAAQDDSGWIINDYYPAGDPFVLNMASFEVEIITPADYIVAGTGVILDEIISEETDRRITVFTSSSARCFAFAVSPYFQRESITVEGVDVHLYYYTLDLPIDDIMEIIYASVGHMSNRVGAYPFDHIRVVETDMFLSGVSFSNIVFMNTATLRQPNSQALSRVLGQQWFSYVVGSNQVTESWLDKGLIRYITAELFYLRPLDLRNYMAEEHALIYGRTDLFMTRSLGSFDSWMDYFHTHHIKSMLMFNALHNQMGDRLFWELVRQYFQTFYLQVASGADFISLAEEIYGDSLQDFFRQWIRAGTVPPLPIRPEIEGEELIQ
ncbi:MAG: M1 family metallopeptidase [Defluviitaleaceae bacterium]|nr:M1 family metallopeptidase [Defluviitaleaceae bacterium]